MDQPTITFGDNLRKLRKKKKLTTIQLGEALDVSPQTISSYEAGRNQPTFINAIKFANHLVVDLDTMCLGDVEQKPEPTPKIKEKLGFKEKLSLLKIAIRFQRINIDENILERLFATYEAVAEKGDSFSLRDAINIENSISGLIKTK